MNNGGLPHSTTSHLPVLSPCLLVSLSPCLLVSLSPCLPISLSPCLPTWTSVQYPGRMLQGGIVRKKKATMVAFLTTGQLAEFFGVNRKTEASWIDNQQLKGHRLPGDRDRRVAVKDALVFARANHLQSEGLQRYVERHGLLPINPNVLLVAPDVLQCGMSLANTVFDVVLFDAVVGMPHVREATTWLNERAPQTVVGLLANEDDPSTPPPGMTFTWQKPTDMDRVA